MVPIKVAILYCYADVKIRRPFKRSARVKEFYQCKKVCKAVFILVLSCFCCFCIFSQEAGTETSQINLHLQDRNSPLFVGEKDLLVLRGDENGINPNGSGVHLFIKKKNGVESVLLVETTQDPEGLEDNFAYRATSWNKFNGDEIRMLNGEVLVSESARYSLISSTTEYVSGLGDCFHIYIPSELVYGYSWTRHGTVKIGKGTFVNIRTFTAKYADYTGDFMDNPFMFDFKEAENTVELMEGYNPKAARAFENLGNILYSQGSDELSRELIELLKDKDLKKADVVFAIDTTGSMKDKIDALINEFIPELAASYGSFGDTRFGLLLYRDYTDDYLYKGLPLKFYDLAYGSAHMMNALKMVSIRGLEGGDESEAVYEALYGAMKYCSWRSDAEKIVILIGDAQPHERPRGKSIKVSQEMVLKMAEENNVVLNCIILPDRKHY